MDTHEDGRWFTKINQCRRNRWAGRRHSLPVPDYWTKEYKIKNKYSDNILLANVNIVFVQKLLMLWLCEVAENCFTNECQTLIETMYFRPFPLH